MESIIKEALKKKFSKQSGHGGGGCVIEGEVYHRDREKVIKEDSKSSIDYPSSRHSDTNWKSRLSFDKPVEFRSTSETITSRTRSSPSSSRDIPKHRKDVSPPQSMSSNYKRHGSSTAANTSSRSSKKRPHPANVRRRAKKEKMLEKTTTPLTSTASNSATIPEASSPLDELEKAYSLILMDLPRMARQFGLDKEFAIFKAREILKKLESFKW